MHQADREAQSISKRHNPYQRGTIHTREALVQSERQTAGKTSNVIIETEPSQGRGNFWRPEKHDE